MKNKEITIYELIGLIKDGKAPKKIKVDNEIYNFHKGMETSYILGDNEDIELNFNYYIENDLLNKKDIEILPEENDEWEDIEEINIENDGHNDFIKNEHGTKCGLTKHSKIIAEKVNELIKNQQKIIERLEGKDEFITKNNTKKIY